MSEMSVKLQALIADYQAGKITASKFVKKAQKEGADNALIGQVIAGTYKKEDKAEISDEAKAKAAETANQPNETANPRQAAQAQQIAQQKAAAAEYQKGSPADAAVKAHDQQDEADIKMQDAMNKSRKGIEEENDKMTDKDYVRAEIGKGVTKADYKAAKEAHKTKREVLVQATKDLAAARKTKDQAKINDAKKAYDIAQEEYSKADKEYSSVKARYKATRKHFLGIGSGTKRIVKAAERNKENYANVDEVREADHLYLSKEAAKASGDKDAVYLTEDEYTGVSKMAYEFEKKIDQVKEQLAKTQNPEQKAELEKRLEVYEAGYKAFTQMADFGEDGKLKTDVLQDFTRTYSGFDDRINLEDEVTQLATDVGLSKVNARRFAKKLGFGREHGINQRLRNAGLAALGAALGFAGQKAIADAAATAEKIIQNKTWVIDQPAQDAKPGTPGWSETIDTPEGPVTIDHPPVPGTPAVPEQGHWVDAEPTKETGETNRDHDESSKLTGPLLGMAGAALTAFLLTSPKTQKAFNEGEIDKVLNNALSVRGDSTASTNANRGLVQEIIDLDLSMVSEDPVRQKAIKAAVIQQAIGGTNTGTANTEEVLAALDFLKYAQKHPSVLTSVEQQDEPPATDPNPVNPTDPGDNNDDNGPKIEPEIHKDVVNDTNYFFDVRGVGPYQYIQAVYPGFDRLSGANKQRVINAFKEANPGVWSKDYFANRQYDKKDENGNVTGKYDKKGLPVNFPDVKLGNGDTLKPDLTKKPKPKTPATGGRRNPKADPKNHTRATYGPGKEHINPHADMTEEEAKEADKKAKEEAQKKQAEAEE